MSDESWLPVVGYEGVYSVSNMGRVRRETSATSTKVGRILVGEIDRGGYHRVKLTMNGIEARHFAHKLVAAAFIGPVPAERPHVNHINFDTLDNKVGNLEYVSTAENNLHSYAAGRTRGGRTNKPCGDAHYSRTNPERLARGERSGGSRLTEAQVRLIREEYAPERGAIAALSRKYGVATRTIYCIVHRLKWTHI
jgi:hypothetical protein